MDKEKKSLMDWIKEHKKKLIVAGVSITVLILAILGIKNRKAIEEAWSTLRQIVNQKPVNLQASTITPVSEIKVKTEALTNVVERNIIPITKAPHDVSEHIRNLPKGYKPSAEKLALAAERGLELLPGQTIVDAYRIGGAAA